MIFQQTNLDGVWIIDLSRIEDERGFFARAYCEKEFHSQGLVANFPQMNTSFNAKAGTIRGMHFRKAPFSEVKMVRCISGAIADVVVDVRTESPTLGKYLQVELNHSNKKLLYIPTGFAHGFQTLTNDVELLYWHSEFFNPDFETGFCFNDPIVGINWPKTVSVVSKKDSELPLLSNC